MTAIDKYCKKTWQNQECLGLVVCVVVIVVVFPSVLTAFDQCEAIDPLICTMESKCAIKSDEEVGTC